MNGWQEYKLEDVVEKFIDYRGKTPEKTLAGIPLITAKIVKNGRIESPNEFISQDNYTKWMRRGYPEINDVVMTTEAPLGEVALLKDKNVALAQRVIVIRGRGSLCDNTFLKYYLQSPFGQEELLGRASGTTVEGIKASELRRIVVSLPPLREQQAIAAVLSSLDDKIDLLHRQNKTLEGIAEALYRHFFVDNRLVGWEACIIGDLAFHEKIGVLPNRKPDLLFHHYSIPAFDGKCMPLLELGISIQSNKYKVTTDTILFSKLNPHKDKRIWLIRGSVPENSVCSTEFQVLRPRAEMCLFFLYGFLSHSDNYEEIAAGVGGTSGSHQRIDPEVIFKTRCFLPDDKALIAYNEMVGPVFDKIRVNLNSMITLSRLRDTLLPKLMSGEVRVRL